MDVSTGVNGIKYVYDPYNDTWYTTGRLQRTVVPGSEEENEILDSIRGSKLFKKLLLAENVVQRFGPDDGDNLG